MFCCSKKYNKISPKEFQPISILKKKDSLIPNKNKRIKRHSIYPKHDVIKENKKKLDLERQQQVDFTNKFCEEIYPCGGCNNEFKLSERKLNVHCYECNKFFHCGIAGACIGENCSVMLEGKKESLKYCMACVNPYLQINIMDNGQSLCKKCEVDPSTDKSALKC